MICLTTDRFVNPLVQKPLKLFSVVMCVWHICDATEVFKRPKNYNTYLQE